MIFYGLFASLPFIAYLLIGKWIRTQEFETIPDMIAELSGGNKPTRITAAILTIVVPFGWLISNLAAFAKMHTQITGLPIEALVIAMTLLSLLFVMSAGMKTVAWTDFFFACVMAVPCILVARYCVKQGAGISGIWQVDHAGGIFLDDLVSFCVAQNGRHNGQMSKNGVLPQARQKTPPQLFCLRRGDFTL